MSSGTLLFEDSRDCAKYIAEELNDVLLLPDDKIKMMRRLVKEPGSLSVEDELRALRKIINTLVPFLAGRTSEVPMEMITILYSLAEMIAMARDELADGALVRLRQAVEDDPAIEDSMMGLHDELLSAQIREVMILHGLQNLVLADYQGDVDLDWMNEFGGRLILGEDPFGFEPSLTRILLIEEPATLLAIEAMEGITRYVVATYDPAPGDPAWLDRMGVALLADVGTPAGLGDDGGEGDGFFRPNFFSVTGDPAEMLAEFAHQLWQTMPDTLLVAVAENETVHRHLVQVLTESMVDGEPMTRLLH